ncbi:MAG: hypothetical protein K8H84_07245 [Sulfuricella denitrificans]|nr:hypothetical protein [Sulfuricella denitrificans]
MATPRKPRKKYRPRPIQTWLPGHIRTDIDIMGFFFTRKLASGTFDAIDSNTVAYLLNVCHKMAADTSNTDMIATCDAAIEAYRSIRRRHDRTGKYGASGPELITLDAAMPAIANYFTTSPQHRIDQARQYVLRVNEQMRAMGVVYADIAKDGRLENVEVAA